MALYTRYRSRKEIEIRDLQFAEIWNASQSVSDVALEYGKSVRWACETASNLRRQGHKLKSMRTGDLLPGRTDEFVAFWNAARSIDEICGKWRMNRKQAINKAVLLRQKGYELKKFFDAFACHAPTKEPSTHVCWAPGSPEKVEALRMRVERGESLWHPLDATFSGSLNPHWQRRIAQ